MRRVGTWAPAVGELEFILTETGEKVRCTLKSATHLNGSWLICSAKKNKEEQMAVNAAEPGAPALRVKEEEKARMCNWKVHEIMYLLTPYAIGARFGKIGSR